MNQGTDFLGIKLTFYGVLAFVLAILGQTLLCGLLLGFCIAAIRNHWLIRQVMQAFFLCFVSSILTLLTRALSVFDFIGLFGGTVYGTMNIISAAINLIVFIFAVIALIRVARGEEAGLPIASQFAAKAFAPEQ